MTYLDHYPISHLDRSLSYQPRFNAQRSAASQLQNQPTYGALSHFVQMIHLLTYSLVIQIPIFRIPLPIRNLIQLHNLDLLRSAQSRETLLIFLRLQSLGSQLRLR